VSAPIDYQWEMEEGHEFIVFTIMGDIIRFEIIGKGAAQGPEENQGTQNINQFILNPYPWIEKYPGLHAKAVRKIREYQKLKVGINNSGP
jgi:hypothetical protein